MPNYLSSKYIRVFEYIMFLGGGASKHQSYSAHLSTYVDTLKLHYCHCANGFLVIYNHTRSRLGTFGAGFGSEPAPNRLGACSESARSRHGASSEPAWSQLQAGSVPVPSRF